MKKVLTTILCAIPLVANADFIGGFWFPEKYIINQGKDTAILKIKISGVPWIGLFEKNEFKFITKAKGKNKVWEIIQPQKGEILDNFSNDTIKSLLYLVEIDCVEGRSRMIMARPYSDYFAKGNPVGMDLNQVQEWTYERDASFHMIFGCAVLSPPEKIK